LRWYLSSIVTRAHDIHMDEDIKTKKIRVEFFQSKDSLGWILIHFYAEDKHHQPNASCAFPPFKDLVKLIEDILFGSLPASFRLDEEGYIKKISALPYSDPYQFEFVIGTLGERRFFDGLFYKKQFVEEFYGKYVAFVANDYEKDKWSRVESENLSQINLDRIRMGLEK